MKTSRFFPLLVNTIPILGFVIFFLLFVVNIPWFDDFEALSGFFLEFVKAKTWSEKWHWLILPNNEHRMATGKLITVLVYYLTGFLDFRWIQGFANLSVIAIWVLLALTFRWFKLSYWYFLPLTLVLFQPQYHLLTFWAITGLQHEPLLALVLLTLYALALRTRFSFPLALILGLITTFTMSNGMFVWIAGIGVLLLRKRFREVFLWVFGMAIGMAGYYYDFPYSGNERSFGRFLEMPHLSVSGFFTYMGGPFDFFPYMAEPWRFVLPTLAGLIIMWIALRWFLLEFWPMIRTYFQPTISPKESTFVPDFLLGGMLFLLINATVIAILRPHFGYFVMLISNYRIYPLLFLCLLYLAWLSNQKRIPGGPAPLITFGLLFSLLSYFNYYPIVVERRKLLLTNAFNQYHSNIGLAATRGTILEPYIVWAFKEPMRMGIFNPPVHFFDDVLKKSPEPQNISLQTDLSSKEIQIVQSSFPVPRSRNGMVLLHLKSTFNSDEYLVPFGGVPNTGKNPFVPGIGGRASFDRNMVKPGTYDMEILQMNDQESKRHPSTTKLTI